MTNDDLEKLSRLAAEHQKDRFMCENCGWYAKAGERVGECHRLPPLSPASMPGDLWRHPIVHGESVCGEFTHRKTAKRFVPDPVEPLRTRIAGIEQDIERLKRGTVT